MSPARAGDDTVTGTRLSVRLRLALWHTAALALVLGVFATGMYLYVMRTTLRQVDRDLAQFTARFGHAVEAEFTEQADITLHDAVTEVARDTRFQDRVIVIYDESGAMLARSFTTPTTRRKITDRLGAAIEPRRLPSPGSLPPRFVTLNGDDDQIRVSTAPLSLHGTPLTAVVLRDMAVEEEFSETILTWLTISVPIALALSGLGGYLIARRTLQPVVAIATQADRIGAQSLHARVDVANPHDELGQLATVLNGLLTRLELSFSQQQRFMADASHDLRTPVAVLRSAADVALSRTDRSPVELRAALETVSDEGRRLTRLVDDLFLLARADAGQQPLATEQVYLEEIAEQSVRAARALAQARDVSVDYDAAAESPFTGDPLLLSRALMNLLDNAIKHSPEGARIRLTLERDLVAHAEAMRYRIAVIDQGGGIPIEMQSRIFDRFVRADETRSRAGTNRSSGAGLGLAIARWIAREHGGDVRLASSGPDGSRFELTLPIASGAT
jgi:heavy metal sensor kinase